MLKKNEIGLYLTLAICLAVAVYIGTKMFRKSAHTAEKLKKEYEGIDENSPELYNLLYDMWRNVGYGDSDAKNAIANETPWSAAFISWLFKDYPDFSRSGSHSYYIVDARENEKNASGNFRLKRINNYRPKIGDIVCKNRSTGNFTYDSIYKGGISHCDIVTKVNKDSIETIGGNVSDKITKRVVPLKDGYINKSGYFAIIENRYNEATPEYLFTGFKELKRGVKSPSVQDLQEKLNALVRANQVKEIAEDGVFGSQTESLLEHFTGQTKITVDRLNQITNIKPCSSCGKYM